MRFEYTIIGIAKGEDKDFRFLYDKTSCRVYTLALSVVKDKLLAREIAVETYRRVCKYAYMFDTDLNAEYWILDIAYHLSVNATQDPKVLSRVTVPHIDNISGLLDDALCKSKNDRGSVLVLKTLSSLSDGDISRLLWYRRLSLPMEYSRAVRELKLRHKDMSGKDICRQLREDAALACPDFFSMIQTDTPTKVAHISHEVIDLEGEDIRYTQSEENVFRLKKEKDKENKKKLFRITALLACCCILLIGIVAVLYSAFTKKPDKNYTDDNLHAIQYSNRIAIVQNGDTVYYQGNDNKLYSYNFTSKRSVMLIDDDIKELLVNGDYLYYRSNIDGKLYRARTDGSERTRLTSVSGTSMCIHDEYIYFSADNGLYRMPLSGTFDASSVEDLRLIETVLDTSNDSMLFRYDIEVGDDGTVFFSSGVGKGIHVVTSYNGEPSVEGLYNDEAYYIQLSDGFIYFDSLLGSNIYLFSVDIETDQIYSIGTSTGTGEGIVLKTGAFYVYNGTVYYTGEDGLYSINVKGTESKLLLKNDFTDLFITHIYVSDDYIYCYYSDGASGSVRKLIAYDKDNGSVIQNIY